MIETTILQVYNSIAICSYGNGGAEVVPMPGMSIAMPGPRHHRIAFLSLGNRGFCRGVLGPWMHSKGW